MVRIVPLQIIANLNSPGLEELIGMRKKLYIDRSLHPLTGLGVDLGLL
jgi:hypothetical protein